MTRSAALLNHVVRGLSAGQSDHELLAAYATHRDSNAFQHLVNRYAPLVGGICQRILGDRQLAEDATQTTLLTLARRPGAVRGDSLAGWLCTVARRTCHKLQRTDRRRSAREVIASRPEAIRSMDDLSVRELLIVLDEEVARLSASMRTALLVCYWQGASQSEAARRLGRTPAAIKGLLERGRAKLLKRLAQRGLTADVVLRALLIAPAGLVAIPSAALANLLDMKPLAATPLPKFAPASGGIIMSMTAIGVSLFLAVLPAQSPPTPPSKSTPPVVATPSGVDSLGDPLPDAALQRLGTLRFRHPTNVIDLALSPDGKIVVTAGEMIIGWEAATGKELWRGEPKKDRFELGGSSYGCRPIAFAPDGRLVTPGWTGEVLIRDATTGKAERFKPKHAGPTTKQVVRSIDISSDNKSLAIGSGAGVLVCDFAGKVLFEIANTASGPMANSDDRLLFGGHYSYGVFAPKGNVLAVITSDLPELIRLLDATTGEELRRIEAAARVVRIAYSADGKSLFATERDQAVRAYSVENAKRQWAKQLKLTNPYENYTSAIAIRPNGNTVAIGATDNDIYLLDAKTGEETGRLKGHGWYPWGLAFTADGRTLFSAGWDGPIRRWDVVKQTQLPIPKGIRGSATVAASPDGKTLAYEDDAGTIRLVDASSGIERQTLRVADASYDQLLFSPDGKRLAGGGTIGDKVHIAIWDLADGKLFRRWDWPKGRDPHSTIEVLSFTPDGSRIAAAVFRQSSAWVWDVTKDKLIAQLPHKEIYGLSYSPDGRTLATAGWDKYVRYWDVDAGKIRKELLVEANAQGRGSDTRIYTVSFAPAGGLIATAHMDQSVRVWDANDLSPRGQIQTGGFMFGAISFSPDGLWIATGQRDGNVQLFDTRSGQKVWDRGKHGGYLYTVGFGRDSRTMLSGGNDGVGYLWDLRPKESIASDVGVLWQTISSEDGAAAFRAMWALADSPDKSIDLLREKLRPGKPADPKRLKQLIVELDNSRFAVRSAAQAELAKVGSQAAGPIREALDNARSTEQRERLNKLLDDIKAAEKPMEVRDQRAVSVLTWIGLPAARALLEEWVKANPDSTLGMTAAAALKR